MTDRRGRGRSDESPFGRVRRRHRERRRLRVMVAHEHMLHAEAMILAIDDDERFEVVAHALDGWEVLELAPAFRPDVLLMNSHLPGLAGPEVTYRLRTVSRETCVVVIGSAREVSDLLDAHEAGVAAYLGACSTLDDLLETMAEVAELRRENLRRPVRRA